MTASAIVSIIWLHIVNLEHSSSCADCVPRCLVWMKLLIAVNYSEINNRSGGENWVGAKRVFNDWIIVFECGTREVYG